MILRGDKEETDVRPAGPSGATLDELFRRAGVQSADALALIDPPNRQDFTGHVPRHLTYAQADRAISALAAKLCRLGLQTDTVVAIQLPNTVESVITLLAVLRAGMIAVRMGEKDEARIMRLHAHRLQRAKDLGRVAGRARVHEHSVMGPDEVDVGIAKADQDHFRRRGVRRMHHLSWRRA